MIMRDQSASPLRSRRKVLMAALSLACAPTIWAASEAAERTPIKVWKDPNCGCCKLWVSHLEHNGFVVTVVDEGNKAARATLGMPERHASCHTAVVSGYVIEGHVPARDIRRLLKDRPNALGLAVPGMPVGSPGMDGPDFDGHRDPYQVLLIRKNGSVQVFNSYS